MSSHAEWLPHDYGSCQSRHISCFLQPSWSAGTLPIESCQRSGGSRPHIRQSEACGPLLPILSARAAAAVGRPGPVAVLRGSTQPRPDWCLRPPQSTSLTPSTAPGHRRTVLSSAKQRSSGERRRRASINNQNWLQSRRPAGNEQQKPHLCGFLAVMCRAAVVEHVIPLPTSGVAAQCGHDCAHHAGLRP